MWEIIDLIIAETIALNKDSRKQFDVTSSIKIQLPHFACSEAIYDIECQKDLERYYYCKEFGVSPYPGSFEDHPADWIYKVFVIKSAINKKEKEAYAKTKNNS